MPTLSKSKLMAYRQCRKRLWLEVHRPQLLENTTGAIAAFAVGNVVGEVARKIYDPIGVGVKIDVKSDGVENAIARTTDLITKNKPIFEAGFTAMGARAFADILLPVSEGNTTKWRMVEVKSSTSVKDYHRDDVAVQSYVARKSGASLAGVSLAIIDSSWTYPGNENYEGLFTEIDLTEECLERGIEVETWISEAQAIVAKHNEPELTTGPHCKAPFDCGFMAYCSSLEPQPLQSLNVLPRIATKKLKALINDEGVRELADVPDDLLNTLQLRVKKHTLEGTVYFDSSGAATALARHGFPAYFLDFETINFAVPIWKGTRPYQQIPFQFSVHTLSKIGDLGHAEFLDLSGNNPSKAFAEAVVASCGEQGPIYVYNAKFEAGRLRELSHQFESLRRPLDSIVARLVDLLPIAEEFYYHPSQKGSWSIKAVLPAIVPALSYENLPGVKDGGMAMVAYAEAINPSTTEDHREKIEQELLAYCKLDTYAMVRLWQFFAGRQDLEL
ncbi:MAG: DUF2779 domain-containing protein [Aestuariivirga sp.]